MSLIIQNSKMEVNGRDDLKAPLLQPPDGVAIAVPREKDHRGEKVKTIKFKLGNIKCSSCATSIESVLGELNGVEKTTVSPLDGHAAISYIPGLVTAQKIKETIEDAGFPVDDFPEQEISVCRLRIKGMACTSCSESVERALLMAKGVKKAVVGLALEEAKVHFDSNLTDTDHIIEAVEDAGFGAELVSSGNDLNKVHLKIEEINSIEDATNVQTFLESSRGVNHVEMDLAKHTLTVSYDPDLTGPRSLIQCIEEASPGPGIYHASCTSNSPKRRHAS